MSTNTGRTHPSSAIAFRKHCDYACALQVYRPQLPASVWVAAIAAWLMVIAALILWFW